MSEAQDNMGGGPGEVEEETGDPRLNVLVVPWQPHDREIERTVDLTIRLHLYGTADQAEQAAQRIVNLAGYLFPELEVL